ncbi:5-guanidino-2-oxopentanoate decarboxylase [Shinella zoogloeoides]|uniref:5-guanidino-2-oxopentanoate decarboxylase n=1 Tax=Shinella zoogloeoides TaxID=352475 RepID=A0A6N8TDH0_SHIZO|nr:5-guanidino-2-oxopentanoate decarboxylase [Shinella zoogloeoides]MXO00989.1 5-guanidino-2-oxopentanoate decarboxylase [Shinella zoogloeoides]UEX80516.1 5-guanidino-2-oxopentanoate decarboxylase [Shinella zoogloeoides]
MPDTRLTTGEYLVRLLESYGVELIFGIPGVHTVELYRGLPATKIRHVTPRHEQGAGFMADGYARVTGKPGVCFIVTGPGMTNIATAMGQAYADSVPMLVISAVNSRDQLAMGQGRLHELPAQRNLVAGVAAFSHTLLDPAQLPEVMARAFTVFNSARPRPVHIEIPLDIIVAEAQHLSTDAWPLPCRAAADPAAIARAATILKGAKRPMIVAGGGAADAAAEITAIAERLDALVFMTINGRGILKPGHALTMTGNLGMPPLLDALAASDAILAIGTEFGETEMYPEPKPLSFGGPLIRIDIDPAQIVTGLRADVPIVADATLAAASLLAALSETRKAGDGAARARAVREAVAAGLWPACRTHGKLMEIVARALPDAIVAGDQTEPVYAVNQIYQAPQVRSFFNSSTGYGTLGYGLPAAFGAKLGAPDRPSVCLIGDGGLQFSVQELASAVEAGIAVAVIIWNNSSYGEIKTFMAERDIPQIGVDIFTPDFLGLARALGCEASRPASLAEFESELKASVIRKVPTVIEIRAGSPFAESLAA